ncbi:hypothetical protein [Bradyrhizobium elkanii]|jgi:hypothetical protein|uniref:hypothetical protein n=1 Tax=Bradyrhizobium elkanii TaxID=29448 RepID=UPI00209DABBB|nr:hypothetical protein [Bradyrhizobium elkanii]MCP1966613.1 hypothetical protein [Bradyrhizobium elkanii]MCS3522780.1 hypothetical protein [Bradyrhizobium elkanii]MCS4070433.1 hypothetical protein [Bradyrhizobium elkanii]MCS4077065.1 hypothetical protein [Bradyrhizobium elkanii]MCS4111883.1 hypothetical protein [Bradyrhizobium elkanii]
MQLGQIIRNFSEQAVAADALLGCGDLVLLARIGAAAERFDETLGEYAAGAVRRFANLASSEDWLALMNTVERAGDPGFRCLTHMLHWSLMRDEAQGVVPHVGCSCAGSGSCT